MPNLPFTITGMKKLLAILLLSAISLGIHAQSAVSIIPKPVTATMGSGTYTLPAIPRIGCDKEPALLRIKQMFTEQLVAASGKKTSNIVSDKASPNADIYFGLSPALGKEEYRLTITGKGISVMGGSPAGVFYGMQSLLQLFPAAIEGNSPEGTTSWKLPLVSIQDRPRFAWRGLMLDVSRHFFTVAQVKQYIDEMVKYKFNLLHLHLTDDQGWRIEIKSLPKLTQVGAWRVDKTGTFGSFSNPGPDEPRTYGGFYTQDDIRELVRYARERYVNILPEIDIPGHSLAAIASYPELSCTPGTYRVNSGERFMIWPGNGEHFYGLLDNTICPANEKAYEFLDKVFTEVAQLFPFEYIHVGGDETARNFWEKSEQIKALMQKENLKNLDEVQSYFVKRVEKIITAKGKKLIGWDEILDGGLPPSATVMSWRGLKGGIEAAKQGHEVVMSPTDFAYIDYMQGDAVIEPPVYASLRLKKAYQFEPVPDGVNASLVKGGQANLWTEQVYNMRHAEYMTWPRGFAIAEVLWSPKDSRNWTDFVKRVEAQFPRLDAAQVKFAPSLYDPIFEASRKDSALVVKMSTEVEGLSIHYSFDNSFPDAFYPVYKEPLLVPKDAANLKVITYRGNKPMGRMIVMPVAELKKRAGLK